MTTLLATKQDFSHFAALLTTRMEALEARLVIKLSVVTAGLIAVAGTLLALFR